MAEAGHQNWIAALNKGRRKKENMMIADIKMSLVKRLHNMHTFIPFIYFELNSGFFLRKAKFIFIYFISSRSFKACYNAMQCYINKLTALSNRKLFPFCDSYKPRNVGETFKIFPVKISYLYFQVILCPSWFWQTKTLTWSQVLSTSSFVWWDSLICLQHSVEGNQVKI